MTDLLTEAQAARFFRLRPKTLERWRKRGAGPAFVQVTNERTSREVTRYRAEDLEAFGRKSTGGE